MLGQQQNRHGQSKSVRINFDYFRWKKQTIQNQSLVENVCQVKKAWHGSVDGNDYISPHCATRMGSLGLLLGPVGTFWGASRIYRKSYCRFNTSTSLLVDQHNLNTLFEFNLAWYHQHPLYDLEKGKKIFVAYIHFFATAFKMFHMYDWSSRKALLKKIIFHQYKPFVSDV